MTETLPIASIIGFVLALLRTTAWMSVSPPFNTRMVPRIVKVGLAAAISIVLAPHMPADQVTTDSSELLIMALTQVATGLVLGFMTLIVFYAAQTAGSMIDLFGGFTMSTAMDPFLNNQSSVFGRFYGLLATVLLFVINGHLLLIKGFMTSFDAVPMGGINLERLKQLLLNDVAMLMLAAVEIAGPLLAAYFLAEVALGLLSKAAPQLNVMTFGLAFKILLTLLMVAWAVPLVPGALETLTTHTLRDGVAALRSGRG